MRSAGTLTWDGGRGDGEWASYDALAANQSNWNANSIPATGLVDHLVFAGNEQTTTNNNIEDLAVGSISFNETAGEFQLSGNSITLNGGITNQSSNVQTINLGIALSSGSHTFDTGSSDVAVSGAVSGSGASLTKSGAGTLALSGNNTYSGGTTISAGTLTAGHDNALGTGSVIVNTGGTLAISDNVTIGNEIQLDGGALQGLGNNSKFSGTLSGSGTLTGPLTLTESAVYQWHLNSASTSGANALSIATGTLTIADGAKIALSFGAGEGVSPVAGGFWDITQTWTIVSKGESGSIIASSVAVAENNKELWNDLGNFQVALESGSLVLIWTPHVAAIPEPSTYAAWLGAATLVGVGWYRRRQRAAKA